MVKVNKIKLKVFGRDSSIKFSNQIVLPSMNSKSRRKEYLPIIWYTYPDWEHDYAIFSGLGIGSSETILLNPKNNVGKIANSIGSTIAVTSIIESDNVFSVYIYNKTGELIYKKTDSILKNNSDNIKDFENKLYIFLKEIKEKGDEYNVSK